MKNKKKYLFKKLSLSLVLGIFFSSSIPIISLAQSSILSVPIAQQILVYDNRNTTTLPNNFRKSTDTVVASATQINTTGLKELNISGSQQFSTPNFKLIKDQLPTNLPLTVMDLRQESHGFLNGLPISWEGDGNKANMGLSDSQIITNNTEQLASLKIGSEVKVSNETVTVKDVYSEENLIKNNGDNYVRIFATDTKVPTAENVDNFLKAVNTLPKDSWVHFHCKEGIGRTTTFMILYDILKNAQNVSLQDIITRQIALSKLDSKAHGLENKGRMDLYTNFYNYVKSGNLNISYSDFLSKNNLSLNNLELAS